MDCHDVDTFLMDMDNGEPIPAGVAHHLESCARCRAVVARMNAASQALFMDFSAGGEAIDDALCERVMGAIRDEAAAEHATDPPTSLRNWVIIGTVLFAGLLGLRFSEVMVSLRTALGPGIDVAMSVILGVFLTSYLCILVASNLRRVGRILGVRLR